MVTQCPLCRLDVEAPDTPNFAYLRSMLLMGHLDRCSHRSSQPSSEEIVASDWAREILKLPRFSRPLHEVAPAAPGRRGAP